MAVELKIPTVGESVTRVQLGAWRKREGERAEKDEALIEIETDKATMELPAPVAGTITRLLKKEGDSAEVGEVIGYMEEVAAAVKAAQPAAAAPSSAAKAPPVQNRSPAAGGTARVMPAAQRALAEAGLRPEQASATGPGGRLLKEDVLAAGARSPAGGAATAPAAVDAPPAPTAKLPPPGSPESRPVSPAQAAAPVRPVSSPIAEFPDEGFRQEEPVPMTPLRQKVAERLVSAQQSAALLTTFNEIDMSAVLHLRNAYKDAFEKKYGIRLGFMSFFVKAAIDALKLIPQVNAEIRSLPGGDGKPAPHIVYRNYYDIGVAVSGGKGLVVPVLRNAERLSFAEVELAIADFGARGRENKLRLEELQGGTFTISNGGVFGSLLSTPIINPPQSGILGLHAIQDRPVARDGQVVVRPMMYVALTYDHRIIDGREAVTFLKRIKEDVEDPARMLVEV